MSKLSWHIQNWRNDIGDIINGCPVEYVKMINPPRDRNPFPGKKIVGRIWIEKDGKKGDGLEGEFVRQGAMGATAYLTEARFDNLDNQTLIEYMRQCSYVHAWEGPNEPQPIDDEGFRPILNRFEVQRANLMHLDGLRSVVLCLNESALKSPHEAEQVGEAAQRGDYTGLHNYAAPRMDSIHHDVNRQFLHYRAVYQWWRNAGFTPAPLLLGEMGTDGGVIGQGGKSWRTFTEGEDDYVQQLAWADERMCEDSYVNAGFVFTAGADQKKFWDFDLIPSLCRKMAMHIVTHPHEEEPMEPEPENVIAAIRQDVMRVWGMGVNRENEHINDHPNHALQREASLRKLGWALTGEHETVFMGRAYVWQLNTLGIVYTEKGHWGPGDIKTAEW